MTSRYVSGHIPAAERGVARADSADEFLRNFHTSRLAKTRIFLTDRNPFHSTCIKAVSIPADLGLGLTSGMKRAHGDISDRASSPQPQGGGDHMIDASNGGMTKRVPKVSKKIQACKFWHPLSTRSARSALAI